MLRLCDHFRNRWHGIKPPHHYTPRHDGVPTRWPSLFPSEGGNARKPAAAPVRQAAGRISNGLANANGNGSASCCRPPPHPPPMNKRCALLRLVNDNSTARCQRPLASKIVLSTCCNVAQLAPLTLYMQPRVMECSTLSARMPNLSKASPLGTLGKTLPCHPHGVETSVRGGFPPAQEPLTLHTKA